MRTIIVLFAFGLYGGPAFAQASFTGQLRPRMETRVADRNNDVFTSMRTRLGVTADAATGVEVFIQLQDVRIWGEAPGTLTGTHNVDLHQGYLRWRPRPTALELVIGRQAVSLGEERLIGEADWVQEGRVFDGVGIRLERGNMSAILMAFQVADAAVSSGDARFIAAYSTFASTHTPTVDLYALHNRGTDEQNAALSTLGVRIAIAAAPLSFRVESAVQVGSRADNDVVAHMVGLRATVQPNARGSATIWYDYLSGDSETADDVIRVFDTMYGTNHKFYGLADVFTNIPVHTAGLGLQDAALKFGYTVSPRSDAALELHRMRAAAEVAGENDFLNEADLTYTHRWSSRLSALTGLSLVDVLPALKAIRPAERSRLFSYIMINATF